MVVACTLGLYLQLPSRVLPATPFGSSTDLGWIAGLIALLVVAMAPFDFWGGYFAPLRYYRQSISLGEFARQWMRGVLVQSLLFIVSSIMILVVGRLTGVVGVCVLIGTVSVLYVAGQRRLLALMTINPWHEDDDKVNRSLERVEDWGLKRLPVTVMKHSDVGFTGGVIGIPGAESIIVPSQFVDQLTADQLAIVLARRLIAVESGSRTRGIAVALIWVIGGFALSTMIPGAGVTSVAELVTTCMGFTLWTFLGLLILPTVSRQSSYGIDSELLRRGADIDKFTETIAALDAVQDDEPSREALIETIFHPVPSVDNRRRQQHTGSPFAWHAARMTLFLSWSCMGLLARAVHCNVGRPELWAMLPTD